MSSGNGRPGARACSASPMMACGRTISSASEHGDRRGARQRTSWRRFREDGARDRRADFHERRPAHRCGMQSRHARSARREKVFTHAVETLEFKAARLSRKFGDCRDRQRIVGRELRIDDVRTRRGASRASNVIEIGHRLARKNRIIGKTPFLRPLDLGIPIGPFDQPQHQTPIIMARRRGNMVDHRQSPLLIGLHRETKARPRRKRGLRQTHRQYRGKVPAGRLPRHRW